ncbi:MAG TPA: hypothetical protein PLA43_10880 [Bryobacteraceae bacterium]|nr:hypothetical protein [Bryobacteraceae bacterium]HOL69850.1 hypothetical protein [Bryobacteraceae bacterium]HOQ43687.1 hypothetical protein [Bryobacteraceae bacterium]HPQ14089.1 hypothetical protein [Bryobacteraceae bacterium]HPU72451.1 hypothetical protein [Bryobacteraceae bacterium]
MVNSNGNGAGKIPPVEFPPRGIILRLEDLPATPVNLERIRERVRLLNLRLLESGTPFRLRVI